MIKDIVWMAWVLVISIVEALLQKWDDTIYLEVDEDVWTFKINHNRRKK